MGRRRKKRKEFQNVTITGIATKGKGVGRTEDNKVVFVDGAVPGDVVDVQVYKSKKSFMHARPMQFVKYSEDRTDPFCEHFGVCGGCKLQHIPYIKQLEYKQDIAENAILRIGKIEVEEYLPILPCIENTFYRNKMEFSFSNKKWLPQDQLNTDVSNVEDVLGFHPSGAFDKIIDIKKCFLQPDPSNDLRNNIKALAIEQGLSFYDARAQKGFLRNIFFRITSIGQVMMIVVFIENDQEKIKGLLDAMLEKHPELTSVYVCINPKKNDYIMDLDINLYHGTKWIEEKLGDIKFKIGPKSFFQTNSKQAARLFDVVKDFAGLSGEENVYDLYTGIGSIALYLAANCKQVVGIEEIGAAIEDAKLNMELNDIKNAVFYAGDVKNILTTEFAEKHGKPDVLITDPPRVGMHANVVKMLLELESPRIVYVSCNPSTQARDLEFLGEKYRVAKVQAVDMFPHTHHIENVALLELRDNITS